MRIKLFLAFLCCLAAVVIVQSETTIEVDENGDEYEVKRFNIEGRQLNGGRSQCVETRRKRSLSASYGDADPNTSNIDNEDNSSSDNDNKPGKGGMHAITSETTPATGIETNTQIDGDDIDGEDLDDDALNLPINEGQMEINAAGQEANNHGGDGEDDYDYDYGIENEDGIKNDEQENAQFPMIAQNQGVKPQITQQVATENLNANGIVVFESSDPPKVNPDTHAVFQLLPVNHAIHAAANYQEEDDGHLHFEEEISPISTTAIWSTGADDNNSLGDLNDDYNILREGEEDAEDTEEADGDIDKPNKGNKKPNKRPNKRPVKKPIKKPNKGNKKPKNTKKPKRRPGQNNKRPMKRRGNRNGNGNHYNADRQRNKKDRYNKNYNKRFNSNLINRNMKRRKQHNDFVKDKGTRTFTNTETMTQTGTANDQKDVNCIIIRKDPPPTTARPFWNILGRNAESTGRSGNFGKRKRINLRLVPKQI